MVKGLRSRGNHGRNIRRMAIELVGAQPDTRMNNPLVADNTFSDWQEMPANDAYGISVAVGANARILRNTLSGRQDGYGIEVGSHGSLVSGNIVSGFFHGIVIQGQSDVVITGQRDFRSDRFRNHLQQCRAEPATTGSLTTVL